MIIIYTGRVTSEQHQKKTRNSYIFWRTSWLLYVWYQTLVWRIQEIISLFYKSSSFLEVLLYKLSGPFFLSQSAALVYKPEFNLHWQQREPVNSRLSFSKYKLFFFVSLVSDTEQFWYSWAHWMSNFCLF